VLYSGTGSGTGSSTGGSGIGGITPLVYNPESDGPPVFHSGVFTGDHGSVQFVQTADSGNQGTGEGDTSESDDKSRARSWWGIRGWFLGDEPIDDGGSQVVQAGDTARTQRGAGTTAGDWLDRNFGGGTFGEPDLSGRVWAGLRGLFSFAPIAGEISDGAELISGVGPNGEKLTPGQRGATALGTLIPFVPAGVARKGLRPLTDKTDDAIEFMGDAGKAAGKNADAIDAARAVGNASEVPAVRFTREMIADSEVIARGSKIRKIDELVSTFGGTNKGWVKKKGWDASGNEWHWYEHHGIGRKGVKPAGDVDPF
jgi:hypothetical protein